MRPRARRRPGDVFVSPRIRTFRADEQPAPSGADAAGSGRARPRIGLHGHPSSATREATPSPEAPSAGGKGSRIRPKDRDGAPRGRVLIVKLSEPKDSKSEEERSAIFLGRDSMSRRRRRGGRTAPAPRPARPPAWGRGAPIFRRCARPPKPSRRSTCSETRSRR